MAIKLQTRVAVAASIAMMMTYTCVDAQEIPLVTGKQWTDSAEQVKKAYLVGIANLVQVDIAYQADNTSADSQTIIPRLARGLKGQTLDTVREGLDRWYVAHPDQLRRPVIETIWFEMVLPGLQKNR